MKKILLITLLSGTFILLIPSTINAACAGLPTLNSSVTIASSCTVDNTTGLNGSLTVSNGAQITINGGYSLVASSIVMSSGAINIAANAVISLAGSGVSLYAQDGDGDHFTPNATLYTTSSGHVALSSLNASALDGSHWDCYDSNANAYPGQAGWFTTNRGDGSFDYNCDGSQTKSATTYSPGSCINCGGYTTNNEWTNPGDLATPACGGSYNKVDLNGSYVGNTCYSGVSCATLVTTNTYYTSCH